MFRVVPELARVEDDPERRLRILIVTKVFPNALEPHAGAFNRQQFAALGRRADVVVWAPVPWFPGAAWLPRRLSASRLAALPAYEWIEGLFVRHPRVLHLPGVDYPAAAALYLAALWRDARKLRGRVDVVLGSFAYPDGVAAVWLGRLLGVPSALAVLGTDLHVTPALPGVSTILRLTLPRASRVIAVSRELAERAIFFGASRERVAVVPNGVDPRIFFPQDQAAARIALGEPPGGKWILFVGRLEAEKGVGALLEAFARIAPGEPSVRLALVGDGRLRARCEQAAARLPGRVLVAGSRSSVEVARWLGAADLLALPSWNEGTPNVVLEALASGRPVVATRVGGIPDVVSEPALGELVRPRDSVALEAALRRTLARAHDPRAIASRATVTWEESAGRLLGELEAATASPVRP